jgi:hypothetical protein
MARAWDRLAPVSTAVVSACFGGSDTIQPQAEQSTAVDWILFTDDPTLDAPPPWQVMVEEPRYENPCMAAKRYKCLPGRVVDHDDVIWIDASHEVKSPTFVEEALAARHDGIAAFAHPRRDCIYDEALASIGKESQGGKYDGQPIVEQVHHYRTEGHPKHWGLWACGTVAWDTTSLRVRAFGDAWLAECERWSFQDQLSFPVVARRLELTPGVFPIPQLERGPWFGNRWLAIHPHLR